MDHSQQALVFTVGRNRYAMDILHLKEVGRMPLVERIPEGPPWLLGMIRMHGRPVRLFDLATLLKEPGGAPVETEGTRSWLVVSRDGDGECHWRVDSVEDIVDYDPSQVIPANDPAALGALDLQGTLVHLLTPDLLCARQAA